MGNGDCEMWKLPLYAMHTCFGVARRESTNMKADSTACKRLPGFSCQRQVWVKAYTAIGSHSSGSSTLFRTNGNRTSNHIGLLFVGLEQCHKNGCLLV